ncbi:hypothetical protein BJ878DRAFT_144654 [Calycina marina]|uniref:Uncharacterized protein n=1 Tax=Calycina marina TaxID=1763456 RepID=A0A9P8CDN4_9HELO|nr:hypothetical protein BJ878DRAFT_144654 [Calycina marina]
MPRSDNLYSGETEPELDEDTESFTDAFSPTDGYFTQGITANVLVPDPTTNLDRKETEDKVLVLGADRGTGRAAGSSVTGSSRNGASASSLAQLYPSQAIHASPQQPYDNTPLPTPLAIYNSNAPISPLRSTTPFSPRSNISTSSRASRRSDLAQSEHTPLMGAPPPAYISSPIEPLQQERCYNTFYQGRPNTDTSSNQSMGRPEYARQDERTEDRTPLYKGSPRQRTCANTMRELIRKILFAALVVAVFVTILMSTLNITYSNGRHKVMPPTLPGDSSTHCDYATYDQPVDPIKFELGQGQDLSILQTVYDEDTTHLGEGDHILPRGEIHIRRTPKGSALSPYFTFNIKTSDLSLAVLIFWDGNARQLKISTPQRSHIKLPGPHCISIEVTAWLPENAQFKDLAVQSITLATRVFDDTSLTLSGGANIYTVSGAIHFPEYTQTELLLIELLSYQFNSRRINVETISGKIDGSFPLYDLLKVQSRSGSITIGVIPQKADPDHPTEAILDINTTCGSINAHFPTIQAQGEAYSPPIRDYITRVETTSGGISGNYYQGSESYFYTMSGKISGYLFPIISSDPFSVSTLTTTTTTGSTSIVIASPIFYDPSSLRYKEPRKVPPFVPIRDDDPYLVFPPKTEGRLPNSIVAPPTEDVVWKNLEAQHQSKSGSITVRYPPAWVGTLSTSTISGKLVIKGKDLRFVRNSNGWGYKEATAIKGVKKEGEGSAVLIKNISGALEFSV